MDCYEQAERYEKDPEFHTLVDTMYRLLIEEKFSVNELRDAYFFASNKFATEQICPAYGDRGED